jgi:hypothetical protein
MRTEVMVVEAGVVKPRLRSQRGRVGGGPRAGDVRAESLGAGVEPGQAPGPAPTPHLGVEVRRIAAHAERSGTIASVLSPPDPPNDLSARPLDLLHAHRAPSPLASPQKIDLSDGPAAFGAGLAGLQLVRRRVFDAVAHAWTAAAEIIHRAPRFTA